MSTRSAIGIFTSPARTAWQARYCHSDGYPSGVGQTLFTEYQRAFRGNLPALVNLLMAERVGWSEIAGMDLTLPPVWKTGYSADKFANYDEYLAWYDQQPKAPQSYTARGETSPGLTGNWVMSNARETWLEYAYIFDVSENKLHIFKLGTFPKLLIVLDMDGLAPDWDKLNDDMPCEQPKPILSDTTDWCAMPLSFTKVINAAHTDSGSVEFYGQPPLKPVAFAGFVVADGKPVYTTPEPVKACEICQGTDGTQQIDGHALCQTCQGRAESYRERLEKRYERLQNAAAKAQRESNATYEHAHQMAEVIPFGQPILVGHHSEKRDRSYRNRIENTYRRAYEHSKRAERYAERARAAEKNRAISSDDPIAVIRLRDELAKLEALQERMVTINKAIQKLIKKPRVTAAEKEAKRQAHIQAMRSPGVAALNANFHAEQEARQKQQAHYPALAPALAAQVGISEDQARELLTPDLLGRIGFPDYATKNNGANIRRIKARIEELSRQQVKAETIGNTSTDYSGGITLTINREENRVQIEFPGKPASSTITALKHNGFKWARSQGVWQRQLNSSAEWAAERVLSAMGATKVN